LQEAVRKLRFPNNSIKQLLLKKSLKRLDGRRDASCKTRPNSMYSVFGRFLVYSTEWGKNMPTYEYKCTDCTHQFEVFQSMRDEPVAVCPECGGRVKRLLSGGAGVIFKGSGFYSTDKAARAGAKKEDAKDGEKSGSSEKPAAQESTPCAGCAAASGGTPPCAAMKNAS
jgi:putative FmdB family regulatory protein